MKYIGFLLPVIVLIIGVIFFLKRRKQSHRSENSAGENTDINTDIDTDIHMEPEEPPAEEKPPAIPVEMLPAEAIPDKSKLVEITDPMLLARIDQLIPGLLQAGAAAENVLQAGAAAVNSAVQAVPDSGEVLYRAIIPAGTQLAESQNMEGAVRGFYHGADGIGGHAELLPVESQTETSIAVNTAAAAMGVASIVVGQYYMTRLNKELGEISEGISQITDFQDNEYRSRVFSVISHVKTMADFQMEILENTELRLSKISQADSLEEECTKLLGQTNFTLAGFTRKTGLDYAEYEYEVGKAQSWHRYQKALLDVLYSISELKYALHLGTVSREQCEAIVSTYTKQAEDTQILLSQWHHENLQRFGIDTDESRRKRSGFDGMLYFLPGLLYDDLNFKSIRKSTAEMIEEQLTGHEEKDSQDTSDLFARDVQLIFQDGKLYYLPFLDTQ